MKYRSLLIKFLRREGMTIEQLCKDGKNTNPGWALLAFSQWLDLHDSYQNPNTPTPQNTVDDFTRKRKIEISVNQWLEKSELHANIACVVADLDDLGFVKESE